MANIPLMSIAAPANATEGNSGNKLFRFVVSRTAPTTGTSSANWALSGDLQASDLATGQATSGVVTLGPGVSSANIDISIRGDTTVEPDEIMTVALTSPTGCILVVQPTGGTVTVSDAYAVTYTPRSGFTGTDTFQYTIADSAGETRTSQITVTVTT
jgi:hypothetical protein